MIFQLFPWRTCRWYMYSDVWYNYWWTTTTQWCWLEERGKI